MEFMKRWIITVLCLFAAIACYVFGIPAGGVFFLILGLLLEGIFWTRLFKRNTAKMKGDRGKY